MDVYVVTVSDAESTSIVSVHKTYDGAMEVWRREKSNIIQQIEKVFNALQRAEHYNWQKDEMYTRMFKNLSCEDPDIIDNYPHETPNITKYEVLD